MIINDIPRSWNELSDRQLEKIILLLASSEPSFLQQVKVLKILLNIRWWNFKKKAKFRWFIKNVPFSQWKGSIAFLFERCERTDFIKIIKIGRKKYHSPMDRIINLTSNEFAVADDLHFAYRTTKKVEYLQYLFHVLYSDQPERNPFNKLDLEKKINKKVPISILLATEITFLGCKNHLEKKFPKIFKKPKKKQKRESFEKIILGMTKRDLSKLPKIEQANIYKFLDQFQEDIITYNESNKK